jgi:hypothetical protein
MTVQDTAPTTRPRRWPIITYAVVALGAAAILGVALVVNRAPTPPPAAPGVAVACADYTKLKSDIVAGILSDAELRARTLRVYDEVKAAPDGRYATVLAAQQLFAAATRGDVTAYGFAIKDLDVECEHAASNGG